MEPRGKNLSSPLSGLVEECTGYTTFCIVPCRRGEDAIDFVA